MLPAVTVQVTLGVVILATFAEMGVLDPVITVAVAGVTDKVGVGSLELLEVLLLLEPALWLFTQPPRNKTGSATRARTAHLRMPTPRRITALLEAKRT